MAEQMDDLSDVASHLSRMEEGGRTGRQGERGWGRSPKNCRMSPHDLSPRWSREAYTRHRHDEGGGTKFLPKLSYPAFHGENPTIWLDKCVDFFTIYRVSEILWVFMASMHMEGNAARWLQVYKLQNGLGSWEKFAKAVLAKFGAHEYSKAMYDLLHLRQISIVQDYISPFEAAKYANAMHNPELDETFFVTQFIKGLKQEIQGLVLSQMPATVDKATRLAQLQHDILERTKFKSNKGSYASKMASQPKLEVKQGNPVQDLSKERQIREYRKLHGLCYACGEKFEYGHLAKCPKRVQARLNMLTTEELQLPLSDEILEQLEKEDEAVEALHQLSLHAISGTADVESIRLRAMVKTQVFLMLVDLGSFTSFINKNFVANAGCKSLLVSQLE
ncbi:hypothetical protein QOZ80_9BG0707950 [Eleusine coracana subsp. coracana]|nr:hypothetical protein QOZ80_9BG0707950 [Eleusine coracana subsp. coracana]